MDEHYRKAFVIIHDENSSQVGAKFNFKTLLWETPKKKKKQAPE